MEPDERSNAVIATLDVAIRVLSATRGFRQTSAVDVGLCDDMCCACSVLWWRGACRCILSARRVTSYRFNGWRRVQPVSVLVVRGESPFLTYRTTTAHGSSCSALSTQPRPRYYASPRPVLVGFVETHCLG